MRERAVIIASGLMAGGALGGVFGAGLRLFGWYREDLIKLPFYDNDGVSQIVSAVGVRSSVRLPLVGAMKKERTALRWRTKAFASDVVRAARPLTERPRECDVIVRQILRSAMSTAANYPLGLALPLARRVHLEDVSVVIEEDDETLFWLETLEERASHARLGKRSATLFVSIFVASLRTARRGLDAIASRRCSWFRPNHNSQITNHKSLRSSTSLSEPPLGSTATALLGIDTLWGGDVMNPSGTARAVVTPGSRTSCFPWRTRIRRRRALQGGGVGAKEPDRETIDAFLTAVDVKGAIDALAAEIHGLDGLRRAFFDGLAECLQVMWDLSMEILGRGPAVPYERCVIAATGKPPEASRPDEKRRRLVDLLARSGHPAHTHDEVITAVDAWRRERMVPTKSIAALADAFIAQFDAGTTRHLGPHCRRTCAAFRAPT